MNNTKSTATARTWKWIRQRPIRSTLLLAFLALVAFVVVDSGCLSTEIPEGTTGPQFLPRDTPYVIYIPALSDDLVESFKATASFGEREFTKVAGAPYRNAVLLRPGIETSMDPLVYKALKAVMYPCGSEIAFGTFPDPARPTGELGFVCSGKLRSRFLPSTLVRFLVGKIIPELQWGRKGAFRIGSVNGVPKLWLWTGAGWFVFGDNEKEVADAVARAGAGNPSLASHPDFVSVLAQQNKPLGFVSFTNLPAANAFMTSTGKPGNLRFAQGMKQNLGGVGAASWGWTPAYAEGIGKDLNIYTVEPAEMKRLRQRHPRIELKTAEMSSEQTAFYAPFSVPLQAIERGNLTEMPRLAGVMQSWLRTLGGSTVFSGEAACLIDFTGHGEGVATLAFALTDAATVRGQLGTLAGKRQGSLNMRALDDGVVEVTGAGWTVQMRVRDDFLLLTTDRAAMKHFSTKARGESILRRAPLRDLARTALESGGTLVGGVVYDSKMILMNWQERAMPHWKEFSPALESVRLALHEKPTPLKPGQVLAGGAWFVFLKETSVECRHHMDKSRLGLIVPISTIPIAGHLFYGKDWQSRSDRFYRHIEGDGGGTRFLVEDFLRSDSAFIPTFAATNGMMYYDALISLGIAAASPAVPVSGPAEHRAHEDGLTPANSAPKLH